MFHAREDQRLEPVEAEQKIKQIAKTRVFLLANYDLYEVIDLIHLLQWRK